MTLTDIIILTIVLATMYLVIHYEVKNNRACHCAPMRRLKKLKKHYKRLK